MCLHPQVMMSNPLLRSRQTGLVADISGRDGRDLLGCFPLAGHVRDEVDPLTQDDWCSLPFTIKQHFLMRVAQGLAFHGAFRYRTTTRKKIEKHIL